MARLTPLSLKALLALSSVHGADSDNVYEQCLKCLLSLLSSQESPEILTSAFETLANMLEEVDPACLDDNDRHLVLQILESTCSAIQRISEYDGEISVKNTAMARGLGALTNLLVILVDYIGDNICGMIWRAVFSSWILAAHEEEEAFGNLFTVIHLLLLNMSSSLAICSASELQLLVSNAVHFHQHYQTALLVIVHLLNSESGLPDGLDKIINSVLQGLSRADPEYLEELTAVMDNRFGDDPDPLSIRLQKLIP